MRIEDKIKPQRSVSPRNGTDHESETTVNIPSIDISDLKSAILQHLKKSLGKDSYHATLYDWRMSLSLALRDLVVDPWFQSTRKTYDAAGKRVYYLSMEFLIGRLLEDVSINLGAETAARAAVA